MEEEKKIVSFSPREIVSELDRYVIGQKDAKKAVAIALRNRWRRQELPPELKGSEGDEHPATPSVTPKTRRIAVMIFFTGDLSDQLE